MLRPLPHVCFVALNAFPLLTGDNDAQLIGGAELQQVIVAKGLAARGYPVSMICLDFGQADPVEVGGVTVLRAYSQGAGIPVLRFVWPRLTAIWRCLKRADADIYYQRTASMLTGVVAAFCARYDRKSIFAAAGTPDFERPTTRIQFARDRWIYSYGLRNVDCILAQNEEQVRLCNENYGRVAHVLPNCFEGRSGRPTRPGRHVLWVSTIRALKQPDRFLDLAEGMPALQFRMIGGPDPAEARLFERVRKRAGRIPNIEFLGFVPHTEIDSYFDDAAVLVNTSESEGFPNTFLQAWARGIPSVSFIDCGARHQGEPVGLVVDSLATMQSTVGELVARNRNYTARSARCIEYVENTHSVGTVLDQYEMIFKDLAESARQPSFTAATDDVR